MDPRTRLTRAILRLILLAAVVSAPIFLVAEEFDGKHALIVLGSNGVTALLCIWLLGRVRKGQVALASRALVWGLLILVGSLATTNGESVHVNVVNYILVTVLASVLLDRRALLGVAAISASLMLLVAWRQASPPPGEELFEFRLEIIAQFLPTYLVVVAILWLRESSGARED